MATRTNSLKTRSAGPIVFVVMALVLAACSSGGGSSSAPSAEKPDSSDSAVSSVPAESSDAEPSAAGEAVFVGYVDGTCGNSWRVHVRAELEDEIAKHPEIDQFEYVCAQGELDSGIASVQSLTSQGVDILIVFSDWGEPLLPALRAAHEAGVTVVPWNSPVGGTAGEDYTAFVGLDLESAGQAIADYFIEKLDGEGQIVGIGGPAGNSYDEGWLNDILPELEGSGVEFLEQAPADWSPATASSVMATLLTKYEKIDGVWSMEATTIKPEVDQFIAAGADLPVFVSLDVNGMMGDFLELKPEHPTLEWGFLTSLTWGVRNALEIGMAAHNGEEWDPALETLQYFMTDCSEECENLYRSDMPDDYVPTSEVDPETLKELLDS